MRCFEEKYGKVLGDFEDFGDWLKYEELRSIRSIPGFETFEFIEISDDEEHEEYDERCDSWQPRKIIFSLDGKAFKATCSYSSWDSGEPVDISEIKLCEKTTKVVEVWKTNES